MDDIDQNLQNQHLNKFHLINSNIKAKIFIKKEDKKECMSFGKKCQFYSLCWENSMEGLIKKI